MVVCGLCHQQVSDLETHLRSQHRLRLQKLLELVSKIKDERKLKEVKRLITQKRKLQKRVQEPQDVKYIPRYDKYLLGEVN